MKEKKNKSVRKVLLMTTAAVLVAAVSVSATLAYLTAKTATKDNYFKSQGDSLSGGLYEPSYTQDTKIRYFSPGNDFDKDPLIQNETLTKNAYVGARVQFFINVDNTAKTGDNLNYVEVDYDTFKKYVTIKTSADVPTVTAAYNDFNIHKASADASDTDGMWEDVTSTVTSGTNDDALAKYFVYKVALGALDENALTSNYSGNGNDTTEPLFTDIHINEYINIPTSGSYSTTQDSADEKKTVKNSLNATSPRVGIADVATLTDANQYNYIFKSFDFQIKIQGYGYETTDAAGDNTNYTTAKSAIIAGLADYD